MVGPSRQPLSPNEQCDLGAVRQTLHCILGEHGFVAEIDGPVSGCGPDFPAGSTSEEDVGRIVAEVVRRIQEDR